MKSNITLSFILTGLMMISCSLTKAQTKLNFQDTRSVVTTPGSYSTSFEPHFKQGATIGLAESVGNVYYALLGMRAWTTDNSGGKAHELAFSNDGRIFFRSGGTTTWEPWRNLLVSSENGSYGIGILNPTEKLAVNGNIRAKEIKVENGNWPDYIFAKSYILPTLNDTEKFIKEKGHLPGIPSAAEINADGLKLGEMNAKLLEKIEELTLHLIEKDKEIKTIKADYKYLKESVDRLIQNQKK